MNTSRLKQIGSLGQSVWLDYLSRDLIASGTLQRLIEEDGVSGVTSNPTIFKKAISGGSAYDKDIGKLAGEGCSSPEIYRQLALRDVADAADILGHVHENTEGRDGFVSLEVTPHLAHDTAATVKEAKSFWEMLDRPNVLIKVPATEAGMKAIRQLIADGINVNVTLLFGLDRYRQAADAWQTGLEDRLAAQRSIQHKPVSVASFFLSRIDTLVDSMLEKTTTEQNAEIVTDVKRYRGQTAIACARLAYTLWQKLVSNDRYCALAEQGARPQRLLWASTGTKNSEYADTLYVDALIGPDTINTMPLETMQAYRDHGTPAPRLTANTNDAENPVLELRKFGIDMNDVVKELEEEGLRKFNASHDSLLDTIEDKCAGMSAL